MICGADKCCRDGLTERNNYFRKAEMQTNPSHFTDPYHPVWMSLAVKESGRIKLTKTADQCYNALQRYFNAGKEGSL